MRKDYLEPEFDIVYFSNEDVVLASGVSTTRERTTRDPNWTWNY